jgi:hypothetical protein
MFCDTERVIFLQPLPQIFLNLKIQRNVINARRYLSIVPLILSDFNKTLAFFNPIFLPTTYSPALIWFGRERGWWVTCNYPTVLKEKNTEKPKEYNLRYLLAKGKASDRL